MTLRARIVLCVMGAFWFLISLNAFRVQVVGVKEIRDRGRKQYSVSIPLIPNRGPILDRVGNELAISITHKSLYVQPPKLADPELAAKILAPFVGKSWPSLLREFSSGKKFLWVKRQMPASSADEAIAAVKKAMVERNREMNGKKAPLRDFGIGSYDEPKRFYPNRELAGPLLGYADPDGNGLEGIELSLDNSLRGERGLLICERDVHGNLIVPSPEAGSVAKTGRTVVLTIDRNIQHLAEKELAEAVSKHNARGGTVVVTRPATGEILAMANAPSFNPNAPGESGPENRKNRAVTDVYEPGSTFKVFTLASALELGAVDEADRFDCQNGVYKYGGRLIHDTHKYGVLDVPRILQVSSNIGSAKISERMEDAKFYDMLRSFGFGSRTGLEVKGEVSGIVPSKDRFRGINRANVAFGQGISVTPVQLAAAMGAVVNGGHLMKPRLVKEVRDASGQVVWRPETKELRRVLSPKTSEQVRRMMGLVTQEGGTAIGARINGFDVGGKTGTAQKVENGVYHATKRVASFIGFFPIDDPELLILVVVDEPKGQTYGGLVAAPAFRNIGSKTAYYMNLSPSSRTASSGVASPPQSVAAPTKSVHGSTRPSVPVAQVATSSAPGTVAMPDLTGLSMGRVVDILSVFPAKLALSGSGVAVSQSPPPGVAVESGTTVRVVFGGAGRPL